MIDKKEPPTKTPEVPTQEGLVRFFQRLRPSVGNENCKLIEPKSVMSRRQMLQHIFIGTAGLTLGGPLLEYKAQNPTSRISRQTELTPIRPEKNFISEDPFFPSRSESVNAFVQEHVRDMFRQSKLEENDTLNLPALDNMKIFSDLKDLAEQLDTSGWKGITIEVFLQDAEFKQDYYAYLDDKGVIEYELKQNERTEEWKKTREIPKEGDRALTSSEYLQKLMETFRYTNRGISGIEISEQSSDTTHISIGLEIFHNLQSQAVHANTYLKKEEGIDQGIVLIDEHVTASTYLSWKIDPASGPNKGGFTNVAAVRLTANSGVSQQPIEMIFSRRFTPGSEKDSPNNKITHHKPHVSINADLSEPKHVFMVPITQEDGLTQQMFVDVLPQLANDLPMSTSSRIVS